MWLLRFLIVVSLSTLLAAQFPVYPQPTSTSTFSCTSGQPSVLYIESNIYGNFFMAVGKIINDTSVTSTMTTNQECMCRIHCLKNPRCMAVSSEFNGNGFLCKFASLGPLETTIDDISDRNATYIFRHASLEGKTWGFRKDQLYYFELPNIMTFLKAKEACKRIPGFRLVIIRSLEVMKSLHSPHRAYYLDLHKKTGGKLVWGDSTPFTNPENIEIRYAEPFTSLSTEPFGRPIFYFYTTFLQDQSLVFPERVICQANPSGVDW
ncbi:uncharacterized protein [Palaemon carinicauda]|uniref:uncharacterized protein n=1 Tax=Palaemon carinicauda TaxID=392227 RepID=UPI0035B6023D